MCPLPMAPRSGCGGQNPDSSTRWASAASGRRSESHTDVGIALWSTKTPRLLTERSTWPSVGADSSPTTHSSCSTRASIDVVTYA